MKLLNSKNLASLLITIALLSTCINETQSRCCNKCSKKKPPKVVKPKVNVETLIGSPAFRQEIEPIYANSNDIDTEFIPVEVTTETTNDRTDVSDKNESHSKVIGSNGLYIEKNLDWGMNGFYKGLINVVDFKYDMAFLGFYMDLYGCRAACAGWENLKAHEKESITEKIDVYLSAGGPGESIEHMIAHNRGVQFAEKVTKHAIDNGYTGIDYFLHLYGEASARGPYVENGQYVKLVSDIIKTTKAINSDIKISITSQAPYFSVDFSGSYEHSLAWVLEEYPDVSANVVMLNEGQGYDSIDDILYSNTAGHATGSAIGDIVMSLPKDSVTELRLVKPINDTDEHYIREGVFDVAELKLSICEICKNESICPGIVGWTYHKDELDEVKHFGETSNKTCPKDFMNLIGNV